MRDLVFGIDTYMFRLAPGTIFAAECFEPEGSTRALKCLNHERREKYQFHFFHNGRDCGHSQQTLIHVIGCINTPSFCSHFFLQPIGHSRISQTDFIHLSIKNLIVPTSAGALDLLHIHHHTVYPLPPFEFIYTHNLTTAKAI